MTSSPPPRFAWDGPESVAGTTDVRLGLYPSTLSLVLPQEWTSTTHGFHAISTVLNSPHKRQPPPKPHSHLPPVVPAVLPRVRRSDFDPYLRAIDHEWARFQLGAAQGHAGVLHPAPDLKSVAPLHSVPQVFFSHSFSLADPPTFAAVTADADPTTLADSLPLLEKFSHHADTVEQHLVLEISHRAPSFFAALTNLHDLHAESEHCLQRIASLRRLLTDLDNNSAKKGLDLVRRRARAANIAVLSAAVKQVASVVEMGRVARALVTAGQWGHALGVIDEMDDMWHNPANKLPLSSLRAYAALPQHLRALTTEIAASLSSEFVSVLRDHLDKDHPDLRDRLRPLIQGLVRTRAVKEGILSWRQVVLGHVRQIVRSVSSEEEGLNRTHFRDMPHHEFILLLQNLYADLLRCIEGIQSQATVIVDILAPLQQPPPVLTPSQAQDELNDILASAAELANTQAASLIAFRQDEHASLDLADFLSFFNDSWAFVVRCEVLSRRMIVALRGVVVGQAKSFLQAFHQKRITSSAKLVEDEQWVPAEISPGLQRITDAIVHSAVKDAPELIVKPDGTPEDKDAHANGVAGSKQLRIEDRTYFAVSATTEVLVLLMDYLRVVVNLSMLTTDVMSRVVEFLKAFNSRTCQVVLGAGAMRSAGLKNITAKHLALASQSLSIMFELIPYVRETFRRHLSPKQAVMLVEFDKLKRDFQEHQNEIHSKLIAIMGDRLNAHVKSLQAVDWNVPKPSGGVNDYIEILVKETVTLHKVLSRYLAVPVVEYVMTQVFAAINHGLSEEYNKIELPNQEAKTRMLADAKYLHQKLSALKNVAPPSGMLVTVVSEKSIPRTGPRSPSPSPVGVSVPVPTPTRSSTLSSANQRLKGLLSGKSSATSTTTPVRASSLALAPAPVVSSPPHNGASSPPPQARKVSAGFKQVEVRAEGEGEEGGSDVGPGPAPVREDKEEDAMLEKAGMSLKGATQYQDIQEQRGTLSPPRPRDAPALGPAGPEPDTEPEQRVPGLEGGGGRDGDEAQVRGLGVLGGAAGELDLAGPGLGLAVSPSPQPPPVSSEAPPPADGARS